MVQDLSAAGLLCSSHGHLAHSLGDAPYSRSRTRAGGWSRIARILRTVANLLGSRCRVARLGRWCSKACLGWLSRIALGSGGLTVYWLCLRCSIAFVSRLLAWSWIWDSALWVHIAAKLVGLSGILSLLLSTRCGGRGGSAWLRGCGTAYRRLLLVVAVAGLLGRKAALLRHGSGLFCSQEFV